MVACPFGDRLGSQHCTLATAPCDVFVTRPGASDESNYMAYDARGVGDATLNQES